MKFHSKTLKIIVTFLFIFIEANSQTIFLGMSREGGSSGHGCIFKTDDQGMNPVILYSFTDTLSGINPEGSLVQGTNKKLYGTTKYGGIYNMGTIFEFDYFSTTYTKLADFDSVNTGCYPSGNLVRTGNSNSFYGMTGHGGMNNQGVIYYYTLSQDTLVNQMDLDSTITGGNSDNGSLLWKIDENFGQYLRGITSTGGPNNQGTIFNYDIYGGTILQKFGLRAASSSSTVRGDLLEISPDLFLGMSATGGVSDGGYIYEYNLTNNTINYKIDFNSATGTAPLGTLTKGNNGKYYGLTSSGGTSSTGTLFEYDYASNTLSNIVDFGSLSSNISNPHGSLMQGTNQKLYGLGTYGGVCGSVLFEYDYTTNQLIEKSDLCSLIGVSLPLYTNLIMFDEDSTQSVWPGDCERDLKATNLDFLYIGVAYNETGPARTNASNNWDGQYADPWTYTYISAMGTPITAKHIDCNGDGIVDTLDAEAIYLNYERSHPLRLKPDLSSSFSHDNLCIKPSRTLIAPGDPVDFEIHMAGVAAPLDFIYGIAFTLSFDTALVDTSRITLDFSNSAFGTVGQNLISFDKSNYSSGLVHAALVRTDKVNLVNVGGVIGKLRLYTSSNISTPTTLTVSPKEIECILANSGRFIIHECALSATIDPTIAGIDNNYSDSHPEIYPNPASDQITIKAGDESVKAIKLYDQTGKLVLSKEAQKNIDQLSVSELANGIYFLQITTDLMIFNSKINILH